MLRKFKHFFTFELTVVLFILSVAFILRVYRVGDILNFHYDQGRDALVIWDLIREPHKFFLIGPTTGLPGIFRGPFYYYLITPFYWLGSGNPVFPAIFLALISVASLYLMYVLAKEIGGVRAGLVSLVLGTFSFEVIYASRWLSNPTPMLLLSMLLVLSMFRIHSGNKNYWILLSAILGLSFFNFGSSGELFYFPVVGLFILWSLFRQGFGKTKSTLNWKIILVSFGVFLFTVLPLLIFNFRHGYILGNNINSLIGSEKSFAVPSWRFVEDRTSVIFSHFSALVFHSPHEKESLFALLLFLGCVYFLSSVIKNDKVKIISSLLMSVFIGLIFYQGNHGNLYAYYLTGYYLIFLMLVGIILAKALESSLPAKVLIISFICFFVLQNWSWIRPYINTSGLEPNVIVLENQKKVIDWVYSNSNEKNFNVDVYVPPVISYSYDYLFKWLGNQKYGRLPDSSQVPLLYTIYEVDSENEDRLSAWLARQKGIGAVTKEQTFGGITVQERVRIK